MEELIELKTKIGNHIENIIPDNNIYNYILEKTLTSQLERLNGLDKLLSIDQHKLVFIGEVGAGKTTAICFLFNLILEESKTKHIKDKKIPVKAFDGIMSIAGGKTTICEVIIEQSAITQIEVEPYTDEEMRNLILDFCEQINAKLNPEKFNSDSKPVVIASELDRALRNVLNLPTEKKVVIKNESGVAIDKKVDAAVEFAKEIGSMNDLHLKLEERANLPSRTTKFFEYDSMLGDEKAWVKELFRNLNVGLNEKCMLPKKIYLRLSKNILSLNNLDFISSIVDTKGLDENTGRLDIDHYLSDETAICIFTSNFVAAPQLPVLNYIKNHLERNPKFLNNRFVLLVIPQNQQPSQVLAPNGLQVEEYEEGIQIKLSQVKQAFVNQSINFLEGNILFYDAKRFFNNDGYPISEYEDTISQEKEDFFNTIKEIINSRKQVLINDYLKIETDFIKITSGDKSISEDDIKKIENIKNKIKYNSESFELRNSSQLGEGFVAYLSAFRASTLNAINRRYGRYTENYIDIYYSASSVVAKKFIEEITSKDIEILKKSIELPDVHSNYITMFLEEVTLRIEDYYILFRDELSIKFSELLQKHLSPLDYQNDFWKNVINEWGRGPGFKDRVSNRYADELDEIGTEIEKIAKQLWKEFIINNLLKFFEN